MGGGDRRSFLKRPWSILLPSAVNRNISGIITVLAVGEYLSETLAPPSSFCFTFAMTWPWQCWASRWPPGTRLWKPCFGLWSGATTLETSPSCRKCTQPFFLKVNDRPRTPISAGACLLMDDITTTSCIALGGHTSVKDRDQTAMHLPPSLNSLTQAPKR